MNVQRFIDRPIVHRHFRHHSADRFYRAFILTGRAISGYSSAYGYGIRFLYRS